MAKYQALKDELKILAKDLRLWKSRRKQGKRDGYSLWDIEGQVAWRKHDARHKHIAYCELRGRERHEIEVPRDDNFPNENLIEEIKREHAEETLCADA
jgi:hypothetical protein